MSDRDPIEAAFRTIRGACQSHNRDLCSADQRDGVIREALDKFRAAVGKTPAEERVLRWALANHLARTLPVSIEDEALLIVEGREAAAELLAEREGGDS